MKSAARRAGFQPLACGGRHFLLRPAALKIAAGMPLVTALALFMWLACMPEGLPGISVRSLEFLLSAFATGF